MPSTVARMLGSFLLLNILILGLPGSSLSAPTAVTVTITDTVFTPAIAVVVVGTRVVWRNDGKLLHSTRGSFWSSPDLKPGDSFGVVFNKLGQFPYHDGRQPMLSGTVIVLAGGSGPAAVSTPGSSSTTSSAGVSYHYQGTATLAVQESWTFYDPVYQSEKGTCNAEVGGGSRSVRWTARFPDLLYAHFPGTEGLGAPTGVPAKLEVYHESQQAKVSPGGAKTAIACQNGTTSTSLPATEDASCQNDLAGWPLTMQLNWSSATGLFLFSGDDNYSPRVARCGELSYAGVLVLVGVDALKLPLGLTSYHILYDDAQAAASPGEIALLRRDRPVDVTRQLTLDFTTPCCDGWAPHTAVFARIGASWHVHATLDLRLQPL